MTTDERCSCGRPATKLCDFPLGYPKWVGHTPKALIVRDVDGNDISGDIVTRCSRAVCDECAIPVNDEVDFCPYCVKMFENVIGEAKVKKALRYKPRRMK